LTSTPVIASSDADAGVEEGQFAQPVLERAEVEIGHREGFGDGMKVTSVPVSSPQSPTGFKRSIGHAVAEAHVDLATLRQIPA
jgi:hypothetical protein